MPVRIRPIAAALLAAGALATLAAPRVARAQDGFLFGPPVVSLSLRGGVDRPNARGDLFDQATQDLTLSRGSFTGGTFAADLGIRVTDRLAFVVGTGISSGGAASHYRAVTDLDNNEITQRSTLRRVPLTGGLRFYLTPPGRSVGRYAWVPSKLAVYVGAGGGATWYTFRQTGDFVDFSKQSMPVNNDILQSSTWGPTAHALGGAEYALSSHVALTAEARYTWARADVNNDYYGFGRADLGGAAATAGLTFRF